MLIGEGLPVGGVKSDVLGCSFKGGTETEQLAIGTPTGTLLSFFSQVPQERNRFFTKSPGIFHAVNKRIDQAIEAFGADDCEILAEFFDGTHAASKEMAEGQFHDATVGKTTVELLSIFLATT